MKIEEQKLAKELREIGYSIREISEKLSVSKSSVSVWVRNIPLSSKAKSRIEKQVQKGQEKAQETLRKKRIRKRIREKEEAKKRLKDIKLSKNEKSLLCAMIYWCEGSKYKNDLVSFTNSDPNLVKTYLKLFRNSFDLDEKKFRICMHLHSYHNESKQRKFWSKATNIPENQFMKSYIKENSGPRRREGYPGCIKISYYDNVVAGILKNIAIEYMKLGL